MGWDPFEHGSQSSAPNTLQLRVGFAIYSFLNHSRPPPPLLPQSNGVDNEKLGKVVRKSLALSHGENILKGRGV